MSARRAAAARLVVLVDGSNVARCSVWQASNGRGRGDHELRRRLVDVVAGWGARSPIVDDLVIVFDGAGPWRAGETRIGAALVVMGSGSESGDTLIERHAAGLGAAGDRWWVVSSDRALQSVAGAGAERTIGSDEFVREVQRDEAAPTDGGRGKAAPPPPSGLGGLISGDARERLERIRRGEA